MENFQNRNGQMGQGFKKVENPWFTQSFLFSEALLFRNQYIQSWLLVCLSLCLFVYLFVCLFVCLSVHLSVYCLSLMTSQYVDSLLFVYFFAHFL